MSLATPADKGAAAPVRADAPPTECKPADSARPVLHWPALDGLRAVAVCAVILHHVYVLPGGYLGVDVFFVLSGFLITTLLIQEWDKRAGTIRLRDFYARRALRLLPALGCVIVAAVALGVLLDLYGEVTGRTFAGATFSAVPWVIMFAGNFVYILHPLVGGYSLGTLSHTWSLAIEEQFYLLWPTLFVLVMRRGIGRSRLARILALLAAAEMIYRAALAHAGYGQFRIYYGTDTHSDGLLLGCALAFWLASGQSARLHQVMRRITEPAMWLASAALLALFTIGTPSSPSGTSAEIAVAVLASGLLVTGIVLGKTPAGLQRLLCSPFAVRTGRRSYGLYLWHFVFVMSAEILGAPWIALFPASHGQRLVLAVELGLAVAVSFVTADLSYRFVELPALRLKRRFQNGELT